MNEKNKDKLLTHFVVPRKEEDNFYSKLAILEETYKESIITAKLIRINKPWKVAIESFSKNYRGDKKVSESSHVAFFSAVTTIQNITATCVQKFQNGANYPIYTKGQVEISILDGLSRSFPSFKFYANGDVIIANYDVDEKQLPGESGTMQAALQFFSGYGQEIRAEPKERKQWFLIGLENLYYKEYKRRLVDSGYSMPVWKRHPIEIFQDFSARLLEEINSAITSRFAWRQQWGKIENGLKEA